MMPKKSNAFDKFYEKAWDPAAYEQQVIAHRPHYDIKENLKLYVEDPLNSLTQMIQIVSDITNAGVEIVVTNEKSKSITGRFPYLETENGTIISHSEAICKHIARMNLESGLLGKTAFGHAKIDEWITWSQTAWLSGMRPCIYMLFGQEPVNQ